MGGTRKLGNRKSVTTQRNGERARILEFDPARKNLRTPIAHVPKREKPVPPPTMLRSTFRRAIALVMEISRALRAQSRGAESSGKRRA
jgi:hypothetical protein